jgi:molybdopterin-containing oxidoreductase family membrane subunit
MIKMIQMIKDEFNSYSRNIKIALGILFFFAAGFLVFGIQILFWGLGYTDMNNLYPFGQWIIGDLGLVALGGGAFTTGFVLYMFRNDKLEPIINSTVLLGFLCYLFTLIFLVFDIGQPLRAGFGYAYPNWGGIQPLPQSMLTEVVWCLTLYFIILFIELLPVPLKHKALDKIPFLHYTGHYLHKIMWIFAAAGTFLSFFHQGSLGGGMWGVLYGKVSWYRPYFFFLAIVGATAGGTAFMALCAYMAGKVMKKVVVPMETFLSLTKISGTMFIFYIAFRIYDVVMLSKVYVPSFDRNFMDILGGYYGLWMIVAELILGAAAIVLLFIKKFREQEKFMVAGIISGVLSISVHKSMVVLHGSSVPNFPWREYAAYNPTIQEWFVMLGGLSVMALIYMWAAKYLPLFPHADKHEGEGH